MFNLITSCSFWVSSSNWSSSSSVKSVSTWFVSLTVFELEVFDFDSVSDSDSLVAFNEERNSEWTEPESDPELLTAISSSAESDSLFLFSPDTMSFLSPSAASDSLSESSDLLFSVKSMPFL